MRVERCSDTYPHQRVIFNSPDGKWHPGVVVTRINDSRCNTTLGKEGKLPPTVASSTSTEIDNAIQHARALKERSRIIIDTFDEEVNFD